MNIFKTSVHHPHILDLVVGTKILLARLVVSSATDILYVPSEVAELQVSNGSVIEIAANSVLSAPAGGWVIQNLETYFSVRATPDA